MSGDERVSIDDLDLVQVSMPGKVLSNLVSQRLGALETVVCLVNAIEVIVRGILKDHTACPRGFNTPQLADDGMSLTDTCGCQRCKLVLILVMCKGPGLDWNLDQVRADLALIEQGGDPPVRESYANEENEEVSP